MAISSITHSFYFEGEAADRFFRAIEESWSEPKMVLDVNVRELQGQELWDFIREAAEVNAKK